MSEESELTSLLLRYEELRDQGAPIHPEELCADCPDLLEEVKRRVAALASMDLMLKAREGFAAPKGSGATGASLSMASTEAEGLSPDSATAEGLPLIPGYTISAELAKGGMGRVYAAWDSILEREVAIKTLLPGASTARFVTESKITARLPHPGIPPVHALGRLNDGRPYLAMKLVRGKTLAEILNARSSPSANQPRLIQVFEQVAQAVGFAHQQGIIHRDLKPLNVMVGEFGEVQVMDWGLAKDLGVPEEESRIEMPESDPCETEAGTVMGTPGYMAPEQARGEPADARADVFALGSMMAAILSGKPALAGSDRLELIRLTAQAEFAEAYARLDACGADEELIRLAKRCLSAKAADRPADAREVGTAVSAYQSSVQERLQQQRLERERQHVEAAEERRRRKLWVGLAAAVLVAVVAAAAGGLYWQGQKAERSEQLARAELDLTAAEEQLRAFRLEDARESLTRAGSRLQKDSPALQERFERLHTAWKLGNELHLIQLGRTAGLSQGMYQYGAHQLQMYDNGKALIEYRASFAAARLDPLNGSVEDVATLIRGSPVDRHILAALDHWALVCAYRITFDPKRAAQYESERDRLLALARAVDPDPELRDRIRNPGIWRDVTQLQELSKKAKGADIAPNLLALLVGTLQNVNLDADDLLRSYQVRYPGEFWLNYQLGRLLGQKVQVSRARGEPVDSEPLRYLQAALAVRPGDALILSSMGTILADDETKRQQAIELFQRSLESNPDDAMTHNNLGTVLRDQGQHEEAVGRFQKAISLDPGYSMAYANLGSELSTMGQVDEAVEEFQKAIELAPDSANYYRFGTVLQDHGRPADAEKQYRKAIEVESYTWPPHSWVRNNLANTLVAQSKFDEAKEQFLKAIELDPKHALARTNLANLLEAEGSVDEAIQLHLQAIKIDPNLANAHFNLANTLYRYGRSEEAIPHARMAVLLNGQNAIFHVVLGLVLSTEGHFLESLESFRRAVELDRKGADQASSFQQWVDRTEALIDKESRLPATPSTDSGASDASELITLAALCRYKKRFLVSTVYFLEAVEQQPAVADDLGSGDRASAARSAVMAAAGEGEGAEHLNEAQRSELRLRALSWLRADLDIWRSLAESDPQSRVQAARTLQVWRYHRHLASVRAPDAIAKLPLDEQGGWTEFWTAVAELSQKVGPTR